MGFTKRELIEFLGGQDYDVEDCPSFKSFKDDNQWFQTDKRCIFVPALSEAAVR